VLKVVLAVVGGFNNEEDPVEVGALAAAAAVLNREVFQIPEHAV
jgi:hypothetical protein|tara:strand:+ start:470 stop:601 length:132 start_codon:yes stop_codon:yes gene_type:complete